MHADSVKGSSIPPPCTYGISRHEISSEEFLKLKIPPVISLPLPPPGKKDHLKGPGLIIIGRNLSYYVTRRTVWEDLPLSSVPAIYLSIIIFLHYLANIEVEVQDMESKACRRKTCCQNIQSS